jgi:ribosomal protein S21
MIIAHAEVTLKKERCSDKAYFDKMLKKFSSEVQKNFVLEEVRARRYHYKPSMKRKLRSQIYRNKWKFYNGK